MGGNVGPVELLMVLGIAMIVLGPKRLPETGRAIGRALREFKDSLSGSGGVDEDAERRRMSKMNPTLTSVGGTPSDNPHRSEPTVASVGGTPTDNPHRSSYSA
jgi:sec-independent protein translocase protein TatA